MTVNSWTPRCPLVNDDLDTLLQSEQVGLEDEAPLVQLPAWEESIVFDVKASNFMNVSDCSVLTPTEVCNAKFIISSKAKLSSRLSGLIRTNKQMKEKWKHLCDAMDSEPLSRAPVGHDEFAQKMEEIKASLNKYKFLDSFLLEELPADDAIAAFTSPDLLADMKTVLDFTEEFQSSEPAFVGILSLLEGIMGTAGLGQ